MDSLNRHRLLTAVAACVTLEWAVLATVYFSLSPVEQADLQMRPDVAITFIAASFIFWGGLLGMLVVSVAFRPYLPLVLGFWLTTLAVVGILAPFAANPGLGPQIVGPSARELGDGARRGGLFDDKKATKCVGELLHKSDLDSEARTHIAAGDLDGSNKNWSLGEDQGNHLWWDVELKMAKKCGLTPWMTAADIGRNALKGGLIDDPSKANCVGAMIRDSALNERFRSILSNTSFDHREENWWYLTEMRRKAFHTVIELNMRARCGVDPWPKTTPWHEPVTTRTLPVK